ncbi:MAG: sigma-54-dependent Fis family transcriptional regulator [Bdellovibrionaceae bacterium]|nr:sigma-54-dependent Fis family transcriptional regulator [Pseudobdellovibrionaceae bacterium]
MKNNLIQTSDVKIRDLLKTVDNIACSKASVLIQGESGTGKELFARYIHSKSQRASKPFFAINCAALPENLLESELFGYEKGAFTGADKKKIGSFEAANGSTFLLDEISEMPALLQTKLLRVLQESEVHPLGSNVPVSIDVRILATSNKDLFKMVENGQFREDLYYRLNVIPLFIPPLRMRPKDLELLSKHFVELVCTENNIPLKVLTTEALDKIKNWKWPGNVRELQNVIERSVLLSEKTEISESDLLIKDYVKDKNDFYFRPGLTVAEVERQLILKTLDFTDQNRTQAAHLLGISIRTLRNKLRDYRECHQIGVSQ